MSALRRRWIEALCVVVLGASCAVLVTVGFHGVPAATAASVPPAVAYSPGTIADGSMPGYPPIPRKARYTLWGRRWPGGTISYADLTAGSYHRGVVAALAAWNARGLRVRFVKARSRATADFQIVADPSIGFLGGYGTEGYYGPPSPGKYYVKIFMPGQDWTSIAWVTSHELGHILGLGHSTGCEVMSYAAFDACRWPDYEQASQGQYRCQLQLQGDLAGVVRLYGGTYRLQNSAFCLKDEAAGPVPSVQAAQVPASYALVATWSEAPRARSYRVALSGAGGPCPTDRDNSQTVSGRSYTSGLNGIRLAPGAYCVVVWSANVDGYVDPASASSTHVLIVDPPLPPPAGSTAGVTASPYEWDITGTALVPPGADFDVAEVGGCDEATPTRQGNFLFPGDSNLFVSIVPGDSPGYVAGAQVCVRFWAQTDGFDGGLRTSPPVDVILTLPPLPPVDGDAGG